MHAKKYPIIADSFFVGLISICVSMIIFATVQKWEGNICETEKREKRDDNEVRKATCC